MDAWMDGRIDRSYEVFLQGCWLHFCTWLPPLCRFQFTLDTSASKLDLPGWIVSTDMNHEKGNHERITSIWAHDEPNKNYMGYFYGVVGAAPPIFLAVKINYSPVCHSHICMRNRSMLLELGILASFFLMLPTLRQFVTMRRSSQNFPMIFLLKSRKPQAGSFQRQTTPGAIGPKPSAVESTGCAAAEGAKGMECDHGPLGFRWN